MAGYRDEFFQSGRHSAEERFWRLKIHEVVDRRQTKSSIALGEKSENSEEDSREASPAESLKKTSVPDLERSKDYNYSYTPYDEEEVREYHYHYPDPRDRSLSIVSTTSHRGRQSTASKDYQYSYPGEIKEESEEQESKEESEGKKEELDEKSAESKENAENEMSDEDMKHRNGDWDKTLGEKSKMKIYCEKHKNEDQSHISSRFY